MTEAPDWTPAPAEWPASWSVEEALAWFRAQPAPPTARIVFLAGQRLRDTTLDRIVAYAMAHGAAPTGAALADIEMGRDQTPRLLAGLHEADLLLGNVAASAVPRAWAGHGYPMRALSTEEWRALFGIAGYTINRVPASRPARGLDLFRGATDAGKHGWSWTTTREVAETFAGRDGTVWSAHVEPHRLLAFIGGTGSSWAAVVMNEYVVDTDGLDIVQADTTSQTEGNRPA